MGVVSSGPRRIPGAVVLGNMGACEPSSRTPSLAKTQTNLVAPQNHREIVVNSGRQRAGPVAECSLRAIAGSIKWIRWGSRHPTVH